MIVALLFTTASTSTLQANGSETKSSELTLEEQRILDERSAIVREYFLEIERAKGVLEQLEVERQELSLLRAADLNAHEGKILNAQDRLVDLKNSYEDFGLEKITKVKEEKKASILSSSAADWELTELDVYWDSKAKKYLAHSAGNWKNNKWKEDKKVCWDLDLCLGWSNLGGYDGYSLYSMHKDINTYNEEFWTLYYSDYTLYEDRSNTASKIPDSRGYAWRYQDRIKAVIPGYWADYDNGRQLGWYFFDFVGGKPTGQTISFKAMYGHTWSSTSITGISYPAGFSWVNSGNQWDDGDNAAFSF